MIESSYGRYNQLVRDPLESRNSVNQANQKIIDIKEMIGRPDLTEIDQLYAKFDCDFAEDFSEIQKRNLKNLLMVDFTLIDLQNTNADGQSLPLLKKGKNINEQIPELKKMFGDIKILRLKKATWVDGQILMQPILTEEQKK